MFAGDEFCHPDGRLVRLGPSGQQQRLLQRFRQCLGEATRQLDDGAAEHAAEQVVELSRLPRDGGDDLRVRVAEDRAHLAGGEVEDLAAVLGEQEAPGGVVDDLAGELAGAGVADEVPVGVGPEGVVGGKRGGGRNGHGSDGTSGLATRPSHGRDGTVRPLCRKAFMPNGPWYPSPASDRPPTADESTSD